MIRGETAAASQAKSEARAQLMSALPGSILLSVLQERVLTVWIGCVAENKTPRLSSTTFTAVLQEQECEFVCCLKPTQCHICFDRQRYLCYCWLFEYRINAPCR